MTEQLPLPGTARVAQPPTRRDVRAVHDVLADGEWHTLWGVQDALKQGGHGFYDTTSISARVRQLRDPKYGGHCIQCRRRRAARGCEYYMVNAHEGG